MIRLTVEEMNLLSIYHEGSKEQLISGSGTPQVNPEGLVKSFSRVIGASS